MIEFFRWGLSKIKMPSVFGSSGSKLSPEHQQALERYKSVNLGEEVKRYLNESSLQGVFVDKDMNYYGASFVPYRVTVKDIDYWVPSYFYVKDEKGKLTLREKPPSVHKDYVTLNGRLYNFSVKEHHGHIFFNWSEDGENMVEMYTNRQKAVCLDITKPFPECIILKDAQRELEKSHRKIDGFYEKKVQNTIHRFKPVTQVQMLKFVVGYEMQTGEPLKLPDEYHLNDILYVDRNCTIVNGCGANSRDYLIAKGVNVKVEDRGHGTFYFEDGYSVITS